MVDGQQAAGQAPHGFPAQSGDVEGQAPLVDDDVNAAGGQDVPQRIPVGPAGNGVAQPVQRDPFVQSWGGLFRHLFKGSHMNRMAPGGEFIRQNGGDGFHAAYGREFSEQKEDVHGR